MNVELEKTVWKLGVSFSRRRTKVLPRGAKAWLVWRS
jgi:hypothetical protein